MPGPPPKSTAIKELTGNPGKRPLNRREPKPRKRKPKMPAFLGPAARVEWRRVLRILEPMGVVTEAEADILAVYCTAFARWVMLQGEIDRNGVISLNAQGAERRNPLLQVSDECERTMLRCMGELGLTPSARVRLTAPESAGDAFEAFLNDL